MINLLNIKTPAEDYACTLQSAYDLEMHGLMNLRKVYWNLTPEALFEEAVFRNEGKISRKGALCVKTGCHTYRTANDKCIVREASSEDNIWWGEFNRPFPEEKFSELHARINGYLQGRDVFVQDVYVGNDPEYRIPVRIVTEQAWHSLFIRNMFTSPKSAEEYKRFIPDFTLIVASHFTAVKQIDTTNSDTVIAVNFAQNLGLIGHSQYAGEIKRIIFTMLNYVLPLNNVLTMKCCTCVDETSQSTLLFGLTDAGKKALTADATRKVIGDDEHGWSEESLFSFENGGYAKVSGISKSSQPELYKITQKFGTILENVFVDEVSRKIDLDDMTLSNNARASYPMDCRENSNIQHPENIFFLTCDVFGVLPPVSKLSPDQAMYYFISGYSSKMVKTQKGAGQRPDVEFSPCYGAPFITLSPWHYGKMLRNKIIRHEVNVWLINTGWIGGKIGEGSRIKADYLKSILNAAVEGKLAEVSYQKDEIFGFEIPEKCPGVPDEILVPALSWSDKEEYLENSRDLAARFVENFRKYEDGSIPEIIAAGPKM